jgi:hypothetical protein
LSSGQSVNNESCFKCSKLSSGSFSEFSKVSSYFSHPKTYLGVYGKGLKEIWNFFNLSCPPVSRVVSLTPRPHMPDTAHRSSATVPPYHANPTCQSSFPKGPFGWELRRDGMGSSKISCMSSFIMVFDWMEGVVPIFCLVGGTRMRGTRIII